MTVDELIPIPLERVRFTLKYQRGVPARSGCYVLSTFDAIILYVGVSDDLNRRFGQHRETEEKRTPTSDGLAFGYYWLQCEAKETFRIERSWLNQYVEKHGMRPVLNKIDSPVS